MVSFSCVKEENMKKSNKKRLKAVFKVLKGASDKDIEAFFRVLGNWIDGKA